MVDYRALCARMADELDHYRQLLTDDRREAHALATEARALLDQQEPQLPADGEVADLAWVLLNEADADDRCDHTHWLDGAQLRRAADLLQRQHSQPVAVSERLPGPEDCDEQGRCWLLTVEDEYPQWRLHSIEGAQPGGAMIWVPVDSSPGVMVACFYASHWLPAYALLTPEAP